MGGDDRPPGASGGAGRRSSSAHSGRSGAGPRRSADSTGIAFRGGHSARARIGAARRRGPALARLYQLRRVPRLRGTWRGLSGRGGRPPGRRTVKDARRVPDLLFIAPVGMLLVIGAAMVYSASFVVGHNDFGNDTY